MVSFGSLEVEKNSRHGFWLCFLFVLIKLMSHEIVTKIYRRDLRDYEDLQNLMVLDYRGVRLE